MDPQVLRTVEAERILAEMSGFIEGCAKFLNMSDGGKEFAKGLLDKYEAHFRKWGDITNVPPGV